MFFKCLDCESTVLDPDLNTWKCPVCGSVNFVVDESQVAGATREHSDTRTSRAVEIEKVTAA